MKFPNAAWVTCLILLNLGGCATHPSIRPYIQKDLISYERVTGDPFEHLVIYPTSTNDHDQQNTLEAPLYIYIDGDGNLLNGQAISQDPTPVRPLALELMLKGPTPALYLGRPCHFIQNPHCSLEFWTVSRYSESVVNSLVVVITQLNRENRSITLVGYSGGGSLAVLAAARLPSVTKVITLGANLDTDAWASQHQSSHALSNSLNPAELMKQGSKQLTFRGWHFIGLQDEIVPKATLKPLQAEAQPSQKWCNVDGGHTEIWPAVWPHIWQELNKADEKDNIGTSANNDDKKPAIDTLFHCQ